jgi:hypothetical protein
MPRKLGEVRTRDLVVLWARAAGRCSHPECKQELVLEPTEEVEATAVGHAAHIVAPGPNGPRGKTPRSIRIHGYENLILLAFRMRTPPRRPRPQHDQVARPHLS